MVELGKRYSDSITGFAGVAVSRTEYLYGCVRVGLEGSTKPGEAFWFDEQRLTEFTNATSGGDMPSPPSRDG